MKDFGLVHRGQIPRTLSGFDRLRFRGTIPPSDGLTESLQSWLPLDVRIVINGCAWLARQMDRAGLGDLRRDNCVRWIADFDRAQQLADRQPRINWPASLNRLLSFVSPRQTMLLPNGPHSYDWTIKQSEWATDVAFNSAASLAAPYPTRIHRGITTFRSADVMRFLGHKLPAHGGLHGTYQG